ncbi:MAG: hypothetical protein EBX50_23160, partial [Chitinophagia bacterium]|nr:hypothetical protein [Chitinophagia bacterium]
GNYLVRSPVWDNGAITNVGAVTFCSGTTGCSGAVSASNSLVGSKASDFVGDTGTAALTNGNYVVSSPSWDNGAIVDAGAVTFCSGTTGCSGAVSGSNSLVGSAGDNVGGSSGGITTLTNGNYVVVSPQWDSGATTNVGAATFCSGATGCSGAVSASNSLIGSMQGDQVGGSSGGITALTNGNYLVRPLSMRVPPPSARAPPGAREPCRPATPSSARPRVTEWGAPSTRSPACRTATTTTATSATTAAAACWPS